MRMIRGWGAVCLALLLSLPVAGCGGSGHAARGTLRIPMYGSLPIPDPAAARSSNDLFVDSLLYSGLVKFSPDLHVIPELAVSLPTISSSGRTYTFTVRQDARFADGRPCTASDVAYSLSRALLVGGPDARRALGGISGASVVENGTAQIPSGIEIVGPLTLRIHLAAPDADFLQKLAFPSASVVDRHVVTEHLMRSWPTRPAGTGAWVLVRRDRDGAVTLAPRPHFYGSLQLRSLELVPVHDPAAGLSLYRKGGVDVAEVPPESIERFSGNSELRETTALAAYYALPTAGNPLELAAKLDRDQLVQDAGMGLSALDTIVPSSVPDYVSSPPAIPTPTNNTPAPDASIGRSDPHDPVMRSLARALDRQMTGRSGASEVSLRIVRVAHLLPDPGLWIGVALPQTSSTWLRSELRSAGKLTNDPVDRMNSYDQVERWLLQRGYVIPLATETVAYLMKPSVQGMQVTPTGIMPENNNWAIASQS